MMMLLAAPLGATTVSISGRQLMVNCAPFLMRGMNYSPAPIGSGPGGFSVFSNMNVLNNDIAQMKAMGVNTVRFYVDYYSLWNSAGGDPDLDTTTNPAVSGGITAALNAFQAAGIYVIMNYWLPYNLPLMTSPNPRAWESRRFQKVILMFKTHPAVLMWVFGNENNANFNKSISSAQLFAYFQEVASAAKANQNPPQPISVILSENVGVGTTLDHHNAALLGSAPAVDLWGINIYQSPGGYVFSLDTYNDPRPLFIGEFGQDSWNNASNALDTASQANFFQNRWGSYIGPRLSALNGANKVVGGCVFEWSDEWWKHTGGSYSTQDTVGGFAINNDNDNWSTEEWYGVSQALAAGANGPRTLRPCAANLMNLWTAAPYNVNPPASCCPACTATYTATPTATPNPCAPSTFDNFDDLNLTNAWGGTWGSAQQNNASYATVGVGSYSGGGITYGFNTVGNWSVLYTGLSALADPAGNAGAGAGAVDLSPWGQVRFWVKTNVPGQYYLTVASNTNLSPGFAWYRAAFNATGTWTEVVLNLDTYTFLNPGGNNGTWAQNIAAATQFTFVPAGAATGELYLDEIRLTRWCGVPTATPTRTPFGTATATPNPCNPFVVDDFTDGDAVNNWGGAWNQAQQVGAGTISIGPGGQTGNGLSWAYSAAAGWAVLYTALNPGADPAGNAGAGIGARDLSLYGVLRFWVKASVAGNYVVKVASNTTDSPGYAWYQAPFSSTTGWTQVSLYLAQGVFTNPGANGATWAQTLSRATQFVFQPVTSTTATLQVDGLEVIQWCGVPSPTFTYSPSRTSSPSFTATPTPSASGTASPTQTASPLPASSATASPTSSRTAASSFTLTPSSSATNSPAPSSTPTSLATASFSPTPSATRSSTPTIPTASLTPSATGTFTGSPTITLSSSPTGSVTPTFTSVPTNSTLTITPTVSATLTVTPSRTLSPSPSATETASATVSFSPSSSATPSGTPTPSRTASATPSLSVTATFSPTPLQSPSVSPTPSPAFSSSATPTLSPVPTAANTLTATGTTTLTPSRTATLPATASLTSSPTATLADSPTPTRTATITILPPLTATSTFVSTLPGNTDGPLVIDQLLPWPNPNPKNIAVHLTGHADRMEIRIYSKAMQCLAINAFGPAQAGWRHLDFGQGDLASGLYYAVATASRNGGASCKAVTVKVLILK